MKSMMSLLLFLFALKVHGEVVVRHPDTDEISYLKAVNDHGTTVVDHLNSQMPSPSDEKRLLQKFERAQTLFLSSDLVAAKVAFIEVTEEALRADWNETQRQAIAISFLRAAQLTNDIHASQNYLVQASQFANDLEFDSSLFPPPLTAQYKEVLAQEKAKSLQIDLKEKFPQHDLIIIDGRRVRAEQMRSYSVMPGRHRVTALSNSHQIFSQELTASQLNLMRADVPAYAIGSCEEPAMSGYQSLAAERVQIIFPHDCARTYTGTSWMDSSKNSQAIPKSLTHIASSDFAMSGTPQPILNRKKLLIIGGAATAIIVAAIIIKNSQRRDETQPVTRQGF